MVFKQFLHFEYGLLVINNLRLLLAAEAHYFLS
jgi:hypothetical protein